MRWLLPLIRREKSRSRTSNDAVARWQLTISLTALSPRRLLMYGFLFWGVLRLSILYIDFGVPSSVDAILTVAGYTLSFLVGTMLVPAMRDGSERRAVENARTYRRVAILLFALAATFLCLRLYDLVVVRGFLATESIAEFRALENAVVDEQRTTGGISFISGIGYPIAIPVMLFALAYRRHLTRNLVVGAILVATLYAVYVIASGNRYVLLAPAVMGLILLFIDRGGIRLTPRGAFKLLVATAMVFAFFTYGTLQRDLLFGAVTREEALEVAPDRKLFTPSREFMQVFQDLPAVAQDAIYGHIDVAWYVTHGWYEFVRIVDFADPNDRAWGGAQFVTALYFFRTIGLDVPGEETWRRNLPTYGFYTTFFGPVYLDFGVGWGLVYCLALGIIAQRLWLGALRRKALGLLLYPFVASAVISMPINNLILAGLGVPIIGVTLVVAGIVGIGERLAASSIIPGDRPRVALRTAAWSIVDESRAITTRHRRR